MRRKVSNFHVGRNGTRKLLFLAVSGCSMIVFSGIEVGKILSRGIAEAAGWGLSFGICCLAFDVHGNARCHLFKVYVNGSLDTQEVVTRRDKGSDCSTMSSRLQRLT